MIMVRIAACIVVGLALLAFVRAFSKLQSLVLQQDDSQNLKVHSYELSSSWLFSRFSFVAIVDC